MKINRLLYRSLTIITLCFSKQAEIRESWAALLNTNFEQITQEIKENSNIQLILKEKNDQE